MLCGWGVWSEKQRYAQQCTVPLETSPTSYIETSCHPKPRSYQSIFLAVEYNKYAQYNISALSHVVVIVNECVEFITKSTKKIS